LLGFWQRLYLSDLGGSEEGDISGIEIALGFRIELEIEKVAEGFGAISLST
jgi:hypothetical protein